LKIEEDARTRVTNTVGTVENWARAIAERQDGGTELEREIDIVRHFNGYCKRKLIGRDRFSWKHSWIRISTKHSTSLQLGHCEMHSIFRKI
jgi:hypothetical protein